MEVNKSIKALYKVMKKDLPTIYPNGIGFALRINLPPEDVQTKTISFNEELPPLPQTEFLKIRFKVRYYGHAQGYGAYGLSGFKTPDIF